MASNTMTLHITGTGWPMTDRLTPEQIAVVCERETSHDFLHALRFHGYVIIHPDDVPHATHANAAYSEGWTDCRNHIFGIETT